MSSNGHTNGNGASNGHANGNAKPWDLLTQEHPGANGLQAYKADAETPSTDA